MNADTDKPLFNFSDGVPDTRLVPFNAISRSFRHAIVSSSRANQLSYGDPRGNPALRTAVAQMLRAERGMAVTEDQVCIVRGSQMGIYLSARLLAGGHSPVALEALSYPPARDAFRACGLNVVDVRQDAQGMDLEHLERVCRKHAIGAVYTTPHHQFPTTVMLPAERRMKLLELAARYNFTVIEDDYDHEFHFSHSPVLPLASTEAPASVIHIGSLSKVLAPGLRVGYLVASEDIVERCAEEIMRIDRQGNVITELAVEELMRDGEVKRHIRRALKIYRARRDHAASKVRQYLPQADFTIPPGGLALWLRFPATTRMREVEIQAHHANLGILPAYRFSRRRKDIPAMRLGYASMNASEFDHAISLLADAIANA
jgi:GntR family transcriptional regulator/MocR family aminotransferase